MSQLEQSYDILGYLIHAIS